MMTTEEPALSKMRLAFTAIEAPRVAVADAVGAAARRSRRA
jgi:hypothetical protein